MRPRTDPAKRFWPKVDRRSDDECWEWLANKSSTGYGVFLVGRNQTGAHRFSWMLHFGEIPDGLFVCHKCDNPPCVNPKHLFLGTHQANMRDSAQKERNYFSRPDQPHIRPGEENGRALLTEKDVIAIRKIYAGGNLLQTDIAKYYGVTRGTIQCIVTRRSWRHI